MTAFDIDAFKAELESRPFRQRSGDGGQRPHWADLAADEARERLYADLPPEPAFVAEADWQDDLVDSGSVDEPEDRAVTGDIGPGFCPRWWGPEGERL